MQKLGLGKSKKAAVKTDETKPKTQDKIAEPTGETIAETKPKKSRKELKAEKLAQKATIPAPDSSSSELLASAEPLKVPTKRRRKGQTFDTSPYTSATAEIEEKDNFFLAPNVQFKGVATMNSNKEHLDFNGFIKLGFAKEEGASEWIPYIASNVNPKEVKINIENSKGAEEGAMITGLHISTNTGKLYATFGSKKADEADIDVFTIDGVLSFDKAKREYKLGKAKQANADAFEGNVMTYNDATSEARYEGKFNLIESNKTLGLTTSGNIKAKVNRNKYHFNAFMAFDMAMPEQTLSAMATAITDNNCGAPKAIDRGSA